MRSLALILVLFFAPAPATGTADPCDADVLPPGETQWRRIRGDGFTFCVPADWSARGPDKWGSGQAEVSWGRGGARDRDRLPFAVVRGSGPEALQAARARAPITRRFSEDIGGFRAELQTTELDGSFRTSASWRRPKPVYLSGSAPTEQLARVQLAIYRTVRFDGH